MLPVQWLPGMIDWIFGEVNEVKAYLDIVEDFSRWVIPYDFRSRNLDSGTFKTSYRLDTVNSK